MSYLDKKVHIFNTITKKSFKFSTDPGSRSVYRFQKSCNGLERTKKRKDLEKFDLKYYFLTLTVSPENINIRSDELNSFLSFLRARFKRAGLPFAYVWTLELQKKRYLEYGVRAPHWHLAILTSRGALPDVAFHKNLNSEIKKHYELKEDGAVVTQKELYEHWGFGQTFCTVARSANLFSYLSKYFVKDFEVSEKLGIRRFGSSNLGYYNYSKFYFEMIEFLRTKRKWLDIQVLKVGSAVRVTYQRRNKTWNRILLHSPWIISETIYDFQLKPSPVVVPFN